MFCNFFNKLINENISLMKKIRLAFLFLSTHQKTNVFLCIILKLTSIKFLQYMQHCEEPKIYNVENRRFQTSTIFLI